ncbi:thiamine pyrophosphokinase [Lasallia pustulata]|uniref:Thiamine pyrophosphokinase n=1 Tax=Lasallia pustulata TaxID=136370 RepID=A0A1W5DBA6_9LECA|nr:thiamine pyrophosphokinase [Lasallia pustulata]
MKSNLDLATENDNFPYLEDDPEHYTRLVSSYYTFHLQDSNATVGYILPWVVEKMPWSSAWTIDHKQKRITPRPRYYSLDEQNTVIAETLQEARARGIFKVLKGWRDELYPIYGSAAQISLERAGAALFGIVTFGVHMTVYVKTTEGMKIWVPRRARNKQTYGGMLDNSVAGGISTGEKPLDSLVREAAEEASLPEDLVRKDAKACGLVTYFYIQDERAGGETDLLQPECQYVYDLEVEEGVVLKPGDNEVENFSLWSVAEAQKALAEGQFKPNCAAVLLDFFVRHGILTAENERDYIEIIARLHRKLPFPMA